MKTVRTAADLPADGKERFAILEQVAVHIPGDERSRTNPGHGYPETTEYHSRLTVFDSQEELERWLARSRGPTPFVLVIRPMKVKHSFSVEFE